MKESMAVSVVMNLLNILGNWLLIPSMGGPVWLYPARQAVWQGWASSSSFS